MDSMFPFGFPLPTAFYLALYVVTLMIHVIFMNYVLAGASYLFVAIGMGRKACRDCVWQHLLKEWMPFATGLAITAGVAPLLFIQILYLKEFYTANLLLSHRWMAILPVLIVCFYLLYLQKTEWLAERGATAVSLVRIGVFLGFAFIAWSWTENHLLSLHEAAWPQMYASGAWFYVSWSLPTRLAMWFLGAFPTLACELMWQAHWTPNLASGREPEAVKRLALTGFGGLIAAGLATVVHLASLPPEARTGLFGAFAGPYTLLAVVGACAQLYFWWRVLQSKSISPSDRLGITAGCISTLSGMTVVRESLRLHILGDNVRFDRHADAAGIDGLWAFLLFFTLNAVLITYVAIQIRRHVTTNAANSNSISPSPEK